MISAILFVVSMVVQVAAAKAARKRQKKLEREAKERADAAKGFQIASEGEASLLPVQYGRGLLGGVRVYHNTSNNYVNAGVATNSGATIFQNSLDANRTGVKHEFLTVQTALCFGDIQSCQMIVVDGRNYTDTKFNSVVGAKEYLDEGRTMGGHRFHFYPSGGYADPLLTSNYSITRPFTNTAYVTAVYALNRDDYQYNGVPDVKFIVEGLKIHSIVGDTTLSLSTTKAYSNNPALCLLDYLTNTVYGRGLEIEYIDLPSFKYAAELCDKTVLSSVPLEGEYWSAKGGTRSIKLYECNLTISPSRTIRDNIETILETMGQAELVWSGGKYKISIEYPSIYANNTSYPIDTVVQYSNNLYRAKIASTSPSSPSDNITYLENNIYWTQDVISAYLTDDDIIRSGDNTIAWPNASERYNFCTVRFLNESKDFVEDSVSWPFKAGSIPGPAVDRGVWSLTGVYGRSDIVTYLGIKYQCAGNIMYSGDWDQSIIYVAHERVLYNGNQYTLNTNAPALIEAYYVAQLAANPSYVRPEFQYAQFPPSNATYWTLLVNPTTTLSPFVDTAWVPYNDANVYNVYREEDSGHPLEADFFEAGITDYYHAMAKAEQRVRFSRSSTVYKFTIITRHTNLEPGDLIKVSSNVLNIPGEVMRIEEIKVDSKGNAEITASKYDARVLAWNANDNEIVAPRILFDEEIPQCTGLAYTTTGLFNSLSSGRLSWTAPDNIRIEAFDVKYTTTAIGSVTNTTVWIDIGSTSNNYFELPSIPTATYTLTVVTRINNRSIAPRNNGLGSQWPKLSVGINRAVIGDSIFASVSIFKYSATIPTIPTGGVFDFDTMTLTTVPVGWSVVAGESVLPLYVAQTRASKPAMSDTDTALTWVTPVLFKAAFVKLSSPNMVINIPYAGASNGFDYSNAVGNSVLISGTTDITLNTDVSYSIYSSVNCTVTIDNTNTANKGKFTVTALSDKTGSFNIAATYVGVTYYLTISLLKLDIEYIKDLTAPPIATTLNATVGVNTVFVNITTIPSYTAGHGHNFTRIYAATWDGISALPTFSAATVIKEFSGISDTISYPTGTKLRLWSKNVSKDGIESSSAYGGINGVAVALPLIPYGMLNEGIYSVYVATIYKQVGSLPATPTGGTYNFSTNAKVAPAGWSFTKPTSSTIPTYACEYIYSTANTTATLTATTWSTPVIISQNGDNGVSALSVILSNDTHTIPTDSAGANGVYTGSGTDIHLYEGATELLYDGVGTTNSSWKIVATPTSITTGLITDAGAYASVGVHSLMTADTANISYLISGVRSNGATFTLTVTQTFAKAKAGISGTNATLYYLDILAPVIFKQEPDAATIGLHTSTTITGKLLIGASLSTYGFITVTGNGDTEATTATANTVTLSPLATAGRTSYTVKLYNQATVAGATLLDTQVIPVVFKGATGTAGVNAITAILSNESHVFPSAADGTVNTYVGSGTQIRVYEGATELLYDGVGTANSSWTVTSAVTNITRGSLTDSGAYVTVGDHSGVATGTDTSLITYTITGKSSIGTLFTITKTQSFSKAKAGTAGSNGTNSTSYWLVSSVAALQKTIGGVFTPTTITFSAMSQSGVTTPAIYSGRYKIYENGSGTAAYTSVADEASKVYTPSGTGVTSIKAELYLAGGVVTRLDEQTTPVVVDGATGGVGANGTSIFVLELYSTGITVAPTSTTATYNFSTDTFTAGNLTAGWSRTMPNGSTTATYRTSFTFSTTTPTVAVTAGIWSTPVIVAQNGTNGTNGINGTNGATGARGSGVFYSTVALANWDDATATARVLAVTGTANVEGDTVTETFSDIWSMTKIWSSGAWAISGQVIDGNLIVTGSIGATKITAGAITAGSAIIANGAIGSAQISNLTADKILTGELNVAQTINMGGNLKLSGEGWIESYSASAYSRLGDYSRMDAGNFKLFRYVPALSQTFEYAYLKRNEMGTAVNNTSVTLPGYWKTQPKLIVSPYNLQFYNTLYSGQNQSILCQALNIAETSTGSMVWTFLPVATLNLAANSGSSIQNKNSSVINTNTYNCATTITSANCTSITANVDVMSYRGNGSNQYFYRQVSYRVGYRISGSGSAYTFTTARVVTIGAVTSGLITDNITASFPSANTWEFYIEYTASDVNTSVFGAISYNYSTEDLIPITSAVNAFNSLSYGANASITVTASAGLSVSSLNTSWEIYQIDYTYTINYSWSTWNYPRYQTGLSVVTRMNGTVDLNFVCWAQNWYAGIPPSWDGSVAAYTEYATRTGSNLSITAITLESTAIRNVDKNSTVNATIGSRTARVYRRSLVTNTTTPYNTFNFTSYTFNLTSSQVLATGTLNWMAIGD